MDSALKKLETADFLIYNLTVYTRITENDDDVETKVLEYLHYTLINTHDKQDANFKAAARYYFGLLLLFVQHQIYGQSARLPV